MKFAVGPASTLRWYQLQTEHMGYLALGCSTPGIAVSILYLGTCAVSLKGPVSGMLLVWQLLGVREDPRVERQCLRQCGDLSTSFWPEP